MNQYKISINNRGNIISTDSYQNINIDLGFEVILTNQKIKLVGLKNLPQTDNLYSVAINFIKELLVRNENLYITFSGKDMYGRWLCNLYIIESSNSIIHLNELLLKKSYCTPYIHKLDEKY